MESVLELSNALSSLVEHVQDSVVRVEARRRGHASGIIWSDTGLIVTAHHAVQRDSGIRVGFQDGTTVDARLIGRDPFTDVAVLQATEGSFKTASWVTAAQVKVGHLMLSVGRHDRYAQASMGIVTKREEAWRTSAGGKVDAYIQTDIDVYPGFSGSALVNARGEIAGMNSSWLLRRLPLTLPKTTMDRVVNALVEHGRMRRGYLGIGAYPVKLPDSAAEELGQRSGLLVISVESGSPAENAQILVGDILVDFASEPLHHVDDLLAQLSDDHIGAPVTIKLLRAGQLEDVQVTIDERA